MEARRRSIAELVEVFTEDGYTLSEVDTPLDPAATAVEMVHRMGRNVWLDLSNYGVVVVIGQGCWGKGPDKKTAKRNFQRQGGRLGGGYAMYVFDHDTLFLGVDGMGTVSWLGNYPNRTIRHPRTPRKVTKRA